MKVRCDKCDGYRDDCQCVGERIAHALERIAYALELANYTKAFPSGGTSGYQCAVCHSWVPNGALHSCGGGIPAGGTWPQPVPPYQIGSGGTMRGCATPNCWLNDGHEGNCRPITIY